MTKHQHITAIITDKKGRVLSIGQNSYTKTHPMMSEYGMPFNEPHKTFLHAEVHAIVRCKNLDKAHKISVFRYNQSGKPLLAKPCKICQSAIDATGIKVIEYTVTE